VCVRRPPAPHRALDSPPGAGWSFRGARSLWRRVRTALGLVLLGLGAIGLLVPLLPGIPLIVAGAAVVGPDHSVIRWLQARRSSWRHRKESR
jgi:hypothetical protein